MPITSNKLKILFWEVIIVFICHLLFVIPVYAVFEDIGTTRPMGIGGAFIGIADDANALLLNPAGISQIENPEINFMYAEPSIQADKPSLKLNYFSFIHPLGENLGALGVGWTGADFSGLHREDTFIINYGIDMRTFIPGLERDTIYTGLSFKSLTYVQSIESKDSLDLLFDSHNSKSVVTGDFGMLYKPPQDKLSFGMAVKNLTQPSIKLEEREKIPLKWGIGTSYEIYKDKTLALDLSRQGDEWKINFGGEMWLLNRIIGLRTGVNLDTSAVGISLGKIFYKNIDLQIDYTFEYPFDLEENYKTHWLSLGAKIGHKGDREILRKETPEKKETAEKIPYFIGPDDELEILVRNHPEFSGTVSVDPYGNILIPLLGKIGVEGMTSHELANAIEKELLPYIETPHVSVVITEYRSKVVYVLGEVAKPGKYFIRGEKMELREAILQAGLPTGLAATWRVYVIKSRGEKPPYRVINLYRILYKGELKNNINLEPGDIVYVPLTILGKISTTLGHLLDPFFKTRALAEPLEEGTLLRGEE